MSAATMRAAEAAPVVPRPPGRWVAGFGPTGPDVLAFAAFILPEVALRLPCYADVHGVLYEALVRLGVGVDRHHRLALSDEARDMLAAYLVAAGRARPGLRTSAAVRGWVVFEDRAGLAATLAGAAWHWRRELDLAGGAEGTG
jgi:hypothetical protein